MDFSDHVAVSAPLGAAVALASGDALAGAACFTAGVFIDLDHLLDYWRETGLNTDLPRFMRYFDERHPKHLVLFMHGWEFCAAAMALSAIFAAPAWAWGACLGWSCHLLLDQKYNRLHPLAYSFVYRARLRFEAKPLMDWQP